MIQSSRNTHIPICSIFGWIRSIKYYLFMLMAVVVEMKIEDEDEDEDEDPKKTQPTSFLNHSRR